MNGENGGSQAGLSFRSHGNPTELSRRQILRLEQPAFISFNGDWERSG